MKDVLIYIATNKVNGRKYVGVTNDFERRLKQHMQSPYPFGRALRKHTLSNFSFDFVNELSRSDALELEELIIGADEVASDKFYNVQLGGNGFGHGNEHLYKTDPKALENMKRSQDKYRKVVIVEGTEYAGMALAARELGLTPSKLRYRLNSTSETFKGWIYG